MAEIGYCEDMQAARTDCHLTALIVTLGLIFAAFSVVIGLTGCKAAPHAAATTLRLTEEEQRARLVLDRSQQRQIRATLAAVAEAHEPVEPPSAALHGVRWRDVVPALRQACDEVEMGVFGRTVEEDRMTFRLRTADDRPGTFIVRRTHDERVYQAEATIGRFRNDEDLAEKLLDAFDGAMRTFGAKRRVPPLYN